jgi:glycosyltransferase involved in cell wall biosynthesis
MRILFLSAWFPYPTTNGSKLRIYHLLQGLAKAHAITLISFSDAPSQALIPPQLSRLCQDIQVVNRPNFQPDGVNAWLDFIRPMPRSVSGTFSPEMARRISEVISGSKIDIVICSQLGTASYHPFLSGTPALFEEVELGVLSEKYSLATSPWQRLRHGLTWLKHRHYLRNLLPGFKASTVVSECEKSLLAGAVPGYDRIEVIPNGIDLEDYVDIPRVPSANQLIFTGSFRYAPNHEAMLWFLEKVYPLIRAQAPDVCLTITGDHAGLPLPAVENVRLTGFVEDIRPLLASAWVSLAPFRSGGGTRLKILEAMALGVPVVATTKGAEGLDYQPGRDLLIADAPDEFAERVIRLLKEPGLRDWIGENGYQLVRQKYAWSVVMPRFLSLVQRLPSL